MLPLALFESEINMVLKKKKKAKKLNAKKLIIMIPNFF